MESLPLELQEHIFTYLYPSQDATEVFRVHKNVLDFSESLHTSGADIFNLRLVSHQLQKGTRRCFLRIIENVSWTSDDRSLQNLAALVSAPDVAERLTSLKISTYLFVDEAQTVDKLPDKARSSWIQDKFRNQLVFILSRTTAIRHISVKASTLRSETVNQYLNSHSIANFSAHITAMIDPLEVIHESLVTTKIADRLESLMILAGGFNGLEEESVSSKRLYRACFQTLTYLAICPRSWGISNLRLTAKHLNILHVVFDDRIYTSSMLRSVKELLSEAPGLREYNISGGSAYIHTSFILQCITPVMERDFVLPVLKLKDIMAIIDISYELPDIKGKGRIETLIFENTGYRLTDDITLSGPSDAKKIDQGWIPFKMLKDRADQVLNFGTGT